jgi:hypothetical protein
MQHKPGRPDMVYLVCVLAAEELPEIRLANRTESLMTGVFQSNQLSDDADTATEEWARQRICERTTGVAIRLEYSIVQLPSDEASLAFPSDRIGLSDVALCFHYFEGRELLAPGIVRETVLLIASSGVTTGIYKLLKAWIDARNGRKLKIKVGDIEVEASQMKEEHVLRIFELLEEKADRKKIRELLLEAKKGEARPDAH